ncbi:hypothetical protein EN45_051640 [Penicillium chrysogenum]|jgi:hypothetical protein|uniref:Uncharacterized protein n=1 Tax=Penicillium chrysogenum TaxID=5076 RepID=A0A167S001_PENCH|nr:hypothetical protein EN45_051640 [Penicillium chrysogenum]
MITRLLSRLRDRRSTSNHFPDTSFAFLNPPRNFSHLTSSVSRHNNSPICIGNNNIAPFDTYLTNTNRPVDAYHLNPILTGSHPTPSRKERVVIVDRTAHIATDTIDN